METRLPSTQLKYLTWWFGVMFEDPANRTPFNSEDGGYQYIRGGPYDGSDELNDEFGHLGSGEIIEKAIDEVEEGGVEWAPGPEHPDHQQAAQDHAESRAADDEDEEYDIGFDLGAIQSPLDLGARPHYCDDWERRRRLQNLRDVDELQFELPKDGKHGSIGHNQPPIDLRITEDTAKVLKAIVVIQTELTKAEPDAKEVVKSTILSPSSRFGKGPSILPRCVSAGVPKPNCLRRWSGASPPGYGAGYAIPIRPSAAPGCTCSSARSRSAGTKSAFADPRTNS